MSQLIPTAGGLTYDLLTRYRYLNISSAKHRVWSTVDSQSIIVEEISISSAIPYMQAAARDLCWTLITKSNCPDLWDSLALVFLGK